MCTLFSSFLINFLRFLCLLQSFMCLYMLTLKETVCKHVAKNKRNILAREISQIDCMHLAKRGSNKIDACSCFVVVWISRNFTTSHAIYQRRIRFRWFRHTWDTSSSQGSSSDPRRLNVFLSAYRYLNPKWITNCVNKFQLVRIHFHLTRKICSFIRHIKWKIGINDKKMIIDCTRAPTWKIFGYKVSGNWFILSYWWHSSSFRLMGQRFLWVRHNMNRDSFVNHLTAQRIWGHVKMNRVWNSKLQDQGLRLVFEEDFSISPWALLKIVWSSLRCTGLSKAESSLWIETN